MNSFIWIISELRSLLISFLRIFDDKKKVSFFFFLRLLPAQGLAIRLTLTLFQILPRDDLLFYLISSFSDRLCYRPTIAKSGIMHLCIFFPMIVDGGTICLASDFKVLESSLSVLPVTAFFQTLDTFVTAVMGRLLL